jgi:hypothetical protein
MRAGRGRPSRLCIAGSVSLSDVTVRMLAANALIGIPDSLRRRGKLFEYELKRGDRARLRNRDGE